MTQRILVCFFALALAPALLGAPLKLDSLTDGYRTYYDVTVIGHNETDLYFTHRDGIANVRLKYLDPELQKRFEYDPKEAEAAERRQIKDDSVFQESVAREAAARAERLAKAAQESHVTSEDSLADPFSDRTLINKPAPKFTPGKWLSEVPATDGKTVIVFFWATWSIPCRKAIPQLNEFQKKFNDKLAVIGISAETQQAVTEFEGPKIEFFSAVDPKSTFATAAGVTSLPEILLIDPKGIVRYAGHPAALDAAKLEKLIQVPE